MHPYLSALHHCQRSLRKGSHTMSNLPTPDNAFRRIAYRAAHSCALSNAREFRGTQEGFRQLELAAGIRGHIVSLGPAQHLTEPESVTYGLALVSQAPIHPAPTYVFRVTRNGETRGIIDSGTLKSEADMRSAGLTLANHLHGYRPEIDSPLVTVSEVDGTASPRFTVTFTPKG